MIFFLYNLFSKGVNDEDKIQTKNICSDRHHVKFLFFFSSKNWCKKIWSLSKINYIYIKKIQIKTCIQICP
jgi:hypothetical protein